MKVFSKISLPVSLAIALSIVAVAFFSSWYLERQLSHEMYLERQDDTLRNSRILLDRDMFQDAQSEVSQHKFSRYFESVRAGDVVRLTFWDTEGNVLSSDLASIIGKKADRHPELSEVYQTRDALFSEKEFDDNEPLQSSIGPLRTALIPIVIEGQFVGVVEMHMTNIILGETIRRTVYSTNGLILAMGILCLLSMIFVVRRVIVEPIQIISVASKKMSDGDFDTELDIKSNDEIGALAKIFVQMKDRLKVMVSELKEKQLITEKAELLDRKVNKELLIEKEELQKFKQAVDNSFDHVIISDPDGKILYANETAEHLTGFSFEEMQGNTPALWGKQMSKAFYQEFWETIKTKKQPYTGEVTNQKKDGTKYLATIRVSPILDSKKNVRFFVGVEQDITEDRRQEEIKKQHVVELEEVNRHVTTEKVRAEGILRYLRSIGEGVFATDRRGTIVFCNATAAAMVGKEAGALIGENCQTVFHFCVGDDDTACDFSPFAEAIRMKKTMSFAAKTFLVEQGKHVPVSGTFSPIVEVNHIAGAIIVFQDITERYELEQMKDRFLSVAAHQLRTPLGSMRWNMELLQGGDLGKLPKRALEAVGELRKNSERMMLLVNDLLNVSRIDQSTIKEVPEETDLSEVVLEAAKALKGEAEKKNMKCHCSFPKNGVPKVSLVRRHVFEAVENLFSNAVRYGKEGGKVECSVTATDKEVILSVSDEGIGIPKEDQTKIFAKFFRAGNAVRSFTDGSGLGLSVVKAYIEESGGTISFESEENVGTTFTVKFPRP